MAERLHYPVGRAAALEARGVADGGPAGRRRAAGGGRGGAGARSTGRSRPRAARLLAGQLLLGHDDERAAELLEQAAVQSEALGVPHLADKARAVAAGGERLRQG